MPSRAEAEQWQPRLLIELISPRRGVVHLAAVTENAILEFCGVLADIVGHACRISPRLGSERPREFSRHLGHLAEMVGNRLNTPVLRDMGYKFRAAGLAVHVKPPLFHMPSI